MQDVDWKSVNSICDVSVTLCLFCRPALTGSNGLGRENSHGFSFVWRWLHGKYFIWKSQESCWGAGGMSHRWGIAGIVVSNEMHYFHLYSCYLYLMANLPMNMLYLLYVFSIGVYYEMDPPADIPFVASEKVEFLLVHCLRYSFLRFDSPLCFFSFQEMISFADKDRDGEVNKKEFLRMMK